MHAQTLNPISAQGTWNTVKCESTHIHAHYAIDEKKLENTKYSQIKYLSKLSKAN